MSFHKTPRFVALCAVIALFFSSHCSADIAGSNGDSGFIPDPGLIVRTIVISENQIIESAVFGITNFAHTSVGDLTVTIQHLETTTSATLFTQVGPGDDSNLFASYSFADGGTNFWNEALSTGNTETITGGTYAASDNTGADISLNTIFGGESTMGTWVFTFQDLVATNAGSFAAVTLNFGTSVPEPVSAFALVSLFGFAAFRRRRSA